MLSSPIMAIPVSNASTGCDRKQIELLRAAGTAGRFARARSLTESTISLARKAIGRQSPGLDDQGVLLRFAEIHYGVELAARVRRYLASRQP